MKDVAKFIYKKCKKKNNSGLEKIYNFHKMIYEYSKLPKCCIFGSERTKSK